MNHVSPAPKTMESRPVDLKDTDARGADVKNLNVNNKVNEGQPKSQVPDPWINPRGRSNIKHGRRRHIKPQKPTIVRAEDIRIEAMDPDDPRSHLPVPPQNIQNIPRESQHGSMSWTACYDDSCRIHFSDKEGSGWFPKAPRRRRR
ncbi:hypothetical protein P167DRAFT_533704 [Morchella conica CCBAS932]|uniref:Uncharacterized protein n=1 Tax=Morchella conica CCBAS932 TaxID=1392247 RepID=A0A3N4KW11_9PEZI|nr:hypothetical protein P167DRAFT_533704 [Morchella conica CCBAS932]